MLILCRMDASTHIRRLGSRALAHGTYAKGVSDGELVARRISRLVQECCKGGVATEIPITDPLAFQFQIDQTRAVRTMTLIIDGFGVIQNGSTRIRYMNGYVGSFIAASTVSIYSSNMINIEFYFDIPTYHSVLGYYLPLLDGIRIRENNYITSINFTQIAPNLTSIETSKDVGYGDQPLQIIRFDCSRLPVLSELVLENTGNGPLNAILNIPSTLKILYISNNSFSGTFTIPASLEDVNLGYTPITGVNNLAVGLKTINLESTDISGSFDLSSMPLLEDIYISNTNISHLINIPSTITFIDIRHTDISGEFNLSGLNNLESFYCESTSITNITNIPSSITELNISYTYISGVFDLSGFNSLSIFIATNCNITDVLNIPTTLTDIQISSMSLTQTEADIIAATLVTNGLSYGSLEIISQRGGIINTSGASYTTLTSRGWSIF